MRNGFACISKLPCPQYQKHHFYEEKVVGKLEHAFKDDTGDDAAVRFPH